MEWEIRVWEEGVCVRTQFERFRERTASFWRVRRRWLRRKRVREVDKGWSLCHSELMTWLRARVMKSRS